VLSELNWQPDYMPRVGVGLPQIDLDAPRLLAHCFLYELDKIMSRRTDVDYVRFMDDIDIGVDSIPAAKRVLRDIDLTLHSRQVRLNAGKTAILSHTDALKHFKIAENEQIDAIEAGAKEAIKNNKALAEFQSGINSVITDWFDNGVFDTGNGDKILKRLFNLAIRFKATVSQRIMTDCLFRRPSVRDAVYRYMCYTSPNMDALHCILDYLESDHAIDDASYIDFANYVVDSTCQFDQNAVFRINSMLDGLTLLKTENMLYVVLKVLSKIGDAPRIEKVVDATYEYWKTDVFNGRLIGSFWPIVFGTSYENKYANIINRSRNIGAIDVFAYLSQTADNRNRFMSVRSIIKARNDSFPNKISHSKFVVLHSVLHGHAVSDPEKLELRQVHRVATKDPYYAGVLDTASPTVE
jgi:hypothetical protein